MLSGRGNEMLKAEAIMLLILSAIIIAMAAVGRNPIYSFIHIVMILLTIMYAVHIEKHNESPNRSKP